MLNLHLNSDDLLKLSVTPRRANDGDERIGVETCCFCTVIVQYVFEIRSKQRLLKMKAMKKETEADRMVKEEERRRKIGLANKGKVPWNKGIKHTQADTRRRIKQRTIEALRNPKVILSLFSDETKEKIRASMKQIWAESSRSKRLMENFTSLWSESIAEAAREGGSGEVELDWDSFEKAELEISSEQQFQLAEEKARTKEQTNMRAEEVKTEKKMRRVVERKKERQERDQRGGNTRKLKQNKENATVASRSKLKKRLTKIHKKKTNLGRIAIGKSSDPCLRVVKEVFCGSDSCSVVAYEADAGVIASDTLGHKTDFPSYERFS
ncbi:unnamed protein product [Eruca vesicaria subsp. sativa]|uniref:Nuclease associated modular domain-containing protein n=1 Tax=Eruca vesicaria subsp. sativa TaxID=29727 RepID=A0ABC8KWC7_ERUVS|nr:unnamed protein product [Eruca vesicaria subsp. sativa]